MAAANKREDWIDSKTGKSVLHVAVCSDHGFLEVLLAHENIKRRINGADLRGVTPLMDAVACGHASAVKLLLAAGATTEYVSYYLRQNALHIAVAMNKKECLAELLNHDSSLDSLNALDDNGNTPLMLCSWDNHECALILLAAGADVEQRNPHTGRNVLHLAILESNTNLVSALLNISCEQTFVNKADSFGDTPLRLAVRLEELAIAKMLLGCPGAQELVWEFPEVVHHAIAANDPDLFAQVLPIFEKGDLMTWTDAQGRTALMVAVELGRTRAVEALLNKGVRASVLRDRNGQSVLHKAVSLGDVEILTLLLKDGHVERLVDLKDSSGQSALEEALASDKFESFAAMWMSGIFSNKPLNSKSETALFVAAKCNSYGSFLMLLMSPQCVDFVSSLLSGKEPVTDVDLERAYLQKRIYASDLYLMTGKKEKNVDWNFSSPQSFQPSSNGRTIFHACALGGFYEIISFFYRFCEIFYPSECDKVDQPDHHGVTPLLLACQCEHKEVVKFLLQMGANICKEDEARQSPLSTIHSSFLHHMEFMDEILSECIVSDGWEFSNETDHRALVIQFAMLCPKGELSTRVISRIFQTYNYVDDSELLLHPLLRFYVYYMMPSVSSFMKVRYVGSVVNAFVFTTYLVFKYCFFAPENAIMLELLRWLSLVCFVLCGIWSLPLSFLPMVKPLRWFEGKALMIPSALGTAYLIFLDGDDRTSLEVAASAVMFTWMALMSFSVSSPFHRQKAMFQVVFASMSPYLPVYFLVTAGFCFYFFVIFHDYYAFNNPFHSLLFSAFQLPRGDLGLIPVLTDRSAPFRGRNPTDFKITKESGDTNDSVLIDTHQELRAMIVEGTALIVFLIVSSAVTNLLTAIAVKSGDEIALGGDVYELASLVDRLEKWELFIFGKTFARLYKLRLLWLMCICSSARENFKPPILVYPLVNKPKHFELFMIHRHLTNRRDLISNKRPRLFLEWYYSKDKRATHSSDNSSFNKMFLEV